MASRSRTSARPATHRRALGLHQPDRLGQVVRGGQRVGHGGQVGAPVDQGDVGALAGQLDGVAPALAPCPAGDRPPPGRRTARPRSAAAAPGSSSLPCRPGRAPPTGTDGSGPGPASLRRPGRPAPGPQHGPVVGVPRRVGRPQRRARASRRAAARSGSSGSAWRWRSTAADRVNPAARSSGPRGRAAGEVVQRASGPAPAHPSRSHSAGGQRHRVAVGHRRSTWPGRDRPAGSGRRSRLSGRSHTPSRCSARRARRQPAAAGRPRPRPSCPRGRPPPGATRPSHGPVRPPRLSAWRARRSSSRPASR